MGYVYAGNEFEDPDSRGFWPDPPLMFQRTLYLAEPASATSIIIPQNPDRHSGHKLLQKAINFSQNGKR